MADSQGNSAMQKLLDADGVAALLAEQLAELLAQDPGVRAGSPEAARTMRAAARRSRKALHDHRKLFTKTAVKSLRSELEWVIHALGPLRHAARTDVLAHRPDLPLVNGTGLDFGAADSSHGAGYDMAYGTALAALESDRYFTLISELQTFCSEHRRRARAKTLPGTCL